MTRILIVCYFVFTGEYVHSKKQATPLCFCIRIFRGIKDIRNRISSSHSKRNEGRIETVEWYNFSKVRSASSKTQKFDKGLLIREAGSDL